jgi:DNA-binding Lrp family transcriptional regulator
MASVGLDDIDRKILNMLQDNAQLSNAELSKAVGLNNSSG